MSRSPRDRELARVLEQVRARCDVAERRAQDPVGAVHRYGPAHDKELVALVASSLAFGNVKTIRAKVDLALERIGPNPSSAADDELGLFARLHGFSHRVFRGEDVARLLIGARRIQRVSGSLGDRFIADLADAGDLREALARFCDAIREAGGLSRGDPSGRRGPLHILPDPRAGSGAKRLLLFLRWMVRPADGVDLGLWPVSPALLLCPVDTHIHKLAKNLGFTDREDLSWKTTEEITLALARFDPEDPVRFDFSLCHMGMLQRCSSRKDPVRCKGCGVLGVCKHWVSAKTGPRDAGRAPKKRNKAAK